MSEPKGDTVYDDPRVTERTEGKLRRTVAELKRLGCQRASRERLAFGMPGGASVQVETWHTEKTVCPFVVWIHRDELDGGRVTDVRISFPPARFRATKEVFAELEPLADFFGGTINVLVPTPESPGS